MLLKPSTTEFEDAVERVEQELRELRLPTPDQDRPRRRMGPGLGISAGMLLLAGAFAATGLLPPL